MSLQLQPLPIAAAPLETLCLADLPLRSDAWVQGVHLEAAPERRDLVLRLVEIGFLPGQRVRVVARAAGGGDPLAVRIGQSTFALRRGEAALVRVSRQPPVSVAVPMYKAAA